MTKIIKSNFRFKQGQKVYCVSRAYRLDELTIGKAYIVQGMGSDADDEYVTVTNDFGKLTGYIADLFSEVSPVSPANPVEVKAPVDPPIGSVLKCINENGWEGTLKAGNLYILDRITLLDQTKPSEKRYAVHNAFGPKDDYLELSLIQPKRFEHAKVEDCGEETLHTPIGPNQFHEAVAKTVKEQLASDPVNHPKHYTQGGIECIDALEAATINLTGWMATLTYQIMKYMWRWNEKGKPLEDLKKARFYLDRLIQKVEEKHERD